MAQGLAFAATPALARLYAPEAFGAAALFAAAAAVLAPLCCWRYELAVLLPASHAGAANLVAVGVAAGVVTGALLVPVVMVGGSPLADWLGQPELATWLRVVPGVAVVLAVHQAHTYWATRRREYRLLAFVRSVQAAVTVGVQLAAGLWWEAGAAGLILGLLAGWTVAAALVGALTWWHYGSELARSLSRAAIRTEAMRYGKYPLYGSWPSLFDAVRAQLPLVFFSRALGAEMTGLFSLALRVLDLPASLVRSTVGQVFLQRFGATLARGEAAHDGVERVLGGLVWIGAAIVLAGLFMPLLFGPVFGARWDAAGTFALILGPAVAMVTIVSPLTGAIGASGRQELSAMWKIGALGATAAVLAAGSAVLGPMELTALFAVTQVVLFSVYLAVVLRVCGARLVRPRGASA